MTFTQKFNKLVEEHYADILEGEQITPEVAHELFANSLAVVCTLITGGFVSVDDVNHAITDSISAWNALNVPKNNSDLN